MACPFFELLVFDLSSCMSRALASTWQEQTKKTKFLFLDFGSIISMNHLGSFTCCLSSGRVCRFCMASGRQLPKWPTEKMCQIRIAATHEVHLQAISVNCRANKRLFVVNEASPFLQLPYFDVTRQLLPDLMHDILEGGMVSVLRRVLRSQLSAGLLSRRDVDEVS